MGLLSLFRTKKDTKVVLEEIQNEIESIEDFRDSASKRQKNMFCLSITALFVFYIISALVYLWFYFDSNDMKWHVLRVIPIIVLPILFIYYTKQVFQMYYRYIGDNKDDRLKSLKKQKKKILEKVIETENFKNAKEILEKYDPKALLDSVSFKTINTFSTPLTNNTQRLSQSDSQLRYRSLSSPMRPMPAIMSTPNQSFRPNLMSGTPLMRGPVMTPQRQPMLPMAPPVRTVKPILPQNRSIAEKLVDYVVGDGPNNRYALICIHCYSHNGMALKEEFEYFPYFCCYCKRFNPSRKQRPMAPTLQPLEQNKRPSLAPVVDEPESDTDSDIGRRIPEQSASIQEISSKIANVIQTEEEIEKSNENQNNSENNKNISKESTNEGLDESVSSGQTSDTDVMTETESELNESKDKSDKEKDIPFMDDI